MEPRIVGLGTALITPLTPKGKIDWYRVQRNIAFQLDQGVDGLIPMGTTAESPCIEWPDHRQVVTETVVLVNGSRRQVWVIAGTGSNCTAEASANSWKVYNNIHKPTGVLLVDPYYNKPASAQIREFYYQRVITEVLSDEDCADTVFVPYIIPGRSVCQLLPEDLLILRNRFPRNLLAVKEATGNLDNMAKTRRLLGPDFSIMSGDDELTATMMERADIRANGVISVMSNIVPAAIKTMIVAFALGETEKGQAFHRKLLPLFQLVTVKVTTEETIEGVHRHAEDKFPNPCGIKTAMAGLGIDTGIMFDPLGPMNNVAVQMVRDGLRQVWRESPEILAPIENFYGVNIGNRLDDDGIWRALAA